MNRLDYLKMSQGMLVPRIQLFPKGISTSDALSRIIFKGFFSICEANIIVILARRNWKTCKYPDFVPEL